MRGGRKGEHTAYQQTLIYKLPTPPENKWVQKKKEKVVGDKLWRLEKSIVTLEDETQDTSKCFFFSLVCFSCERAELRVHERKTWVAETLQTRLKEKETPLLSEQSTKSGKKARLFTGAAYNKYS